MKRALPITTVLVSSVSLAWGADLSSQPASPPLPAPYSWSGFYGGASIGYSYLNDRVSHVDSGDGCFWDCASLQGLKDDSNGVIGGVQAGYNFQAGRVVLGVEAGVSGASNSGELNTFCTGSTCDYTQKSHLTALATARGRLGYDFGGTLLYATGGWAGGRVSNHVNSYDNIAVWNIGQWRRGWTVGGGVEYALSGSWSVKAEALYFDLGTKTDTFTYNNYGFYYYPAKFEDEGLVARVGLNFHLGEPALAVPTKF